MVNDQVQLDCLVGDGNPMPTLQWFGDSTATVNTPQYSFLAQVGDHNKEFRCDGINSMDTVSDSIILQVFCEQNLPYIAYIDHPTVSFQYFAI